jgi:hypothetical protein
MLPLYYCLIFTSVFISGNDVIHLLTETDQELRVDLTDFDGNEAYAMYSTFKVGDENSKYELTVSEYSGTAGMYVSYFTLSIPKTKCFVMY